MVSRRSRVRIPPEASDPNSNPWTLATFFSVFPSSFFESPHPQLKDTRLVNYKVSVVDSEDGTAASVRVFVEFMSKDTI